MRIAHQCLTGLLVALPDQGPSAIAVITAEFRLDACCILPPAAQFVG